MSGRLIFKICLLGDGATGKTSLRTRFMGRGFNPNHNLTVGADFAAVEKTIEYNGKNHSVTFQIWDLAGQQRFQEVRSRFYLGTLGALCLFDITRSDSFQNIPSWINELWKHNGKGVVPLVLIGNKSDLRDGKSVSPSNALTYCEQLTSNTLAHGFDVQYVETSAKNGDNIDLAFETLGRKIMDKMSKKS